MEVVMSPTPDEVQRILDKLLESGNFSKEEVLALTNAANDPEALDRILNALKEAGADQIGSGPPLNIEDYYREGTEKFALRWPLQVTLPFPFDQIDRKTQFFVLFQEWTRRELEGITTLNSGDTEQAKSIYDECLKRAQQLKVNELVARSYEGMMRLAQKLSDRKAELKWSERAVKARSANG
jgi:hypothetical protein